MKHRLLTKLILVGLTFFSACQKDELDNDIPQNALILSTEGYGNNTKTSVQDKSVQWVGGESVRINSHDYTVNVTNSDKAYITQGSNPISGNIRAFYACGNIKGESGDTPTVDIPSSYTCSYDGSGKQIIALPMAATANSGANSVQFKHLTAAVKVMIRNEFVNKTLVIDRVVVSSEHYVLSGKMTLDLSDATNYGVEKKSGNGSVSVNIPEGLIVPFYNNSESNIREVQVPIRPIDNDHPITITIYAHVSGNANFTYTFKHTVDIPNNLNRNIMLSAGCRIHTGTGNHVSVGDPSIPLTFEAKSAGSTVSFNKQGRSINLEYSKNGGPWTTYTDAITLTNIGDIVSFRGDNSGIGTYNTYVSFSCTGQCYIYGNIMSLLSSVDFEDVTSLGFPNAFTGLFRNNTNIYNHPSKTLKLPATTLTSTCYSYMFSGCTNLTIAPELPATTLTPFCYYSMFDGCTNLKAAPDLPATTLANSCYSQMFNGCASLISAPTLPATTLAEQCYTGMFYNCSNLAVAPNLPATTLTPLCYYDMFHGCRSLISAPDLPATTLSQRCYHYMFTGCESLVIAPELPATMLTQQCYQGMFLCCYGLTTVPELPATTLAPSCYQDMFAGCTNLTSAPELPATTLTQQCYYGMFSGCSNLTTAPSLPATILATQCYYSMFQGCTSLITAPALPATTLTQQCYYGMFINCSGLTSAPELPATILAARCYENMFGGCYNLTLAPDLPSTTLTDSCYRRMFYDCINLTVAPDLLASTLTNHCYEGMFQNCIRLNSVKCLATDISASDCTLNWLSSVTASGTFTKASTMTDWETGASGIPSGWTVNNQ